MLWLLCWKLGKIGYNSHLTPSDPVFSEKFATIKVSDNENEMLDNTELNIFANAKFNGESIIVLTIASIVPLFTTSWIVAASAQPTIPPVLVTPLTVAWFSQSVTLPVETATSPPTSHLEVTAT